MSLDFQPGSFRQHPPLDKSDVYPHIAEIGLDYQRKSGYPDTRTCSVKISAARVTCGLVTIRAKSPRRWCPSCTPQLGVTGATNLKLAWLHPPSFFDAVSSTVDRSVSHLWRHRTLLLAMSKRVYTSTTISSAFWSSISAAPKHAAHLPE